MNIFDLKNNAVFLSCWYERSRPVQVVCFSVFIISAMFIYFLNISSHPPYGTTVVQALFEMFVGVQALVLLVQGTLFVGHMGTRERSSETLDFHRNSPQPATSKIFGLLFGGTWFEWTVFLILFACELPFVFTPQVGLMQVLLINISLIMTGLFFHATAAMFSLLSPKKKGAGTGVLFILLAWAFWGTIPMMRIESSSLYAHFMGAGVVQYIHPDPSIGMNGHFYNMDFPLIILQAIVQLPLLWLAIKGIHRIFAKPNSPAWSKTDVICFGGFILFIMNGFFIAQYIDLQSGSFLAKKYAQYRRHIPTTTDFLRQQCGTVAFLFLLVGFASSFFCAPTYFKRSKYLVLQRRGLIKGSLFDDGASALPMITFYLGLGAIFMTPYFLAITSSLFNKVSCFVMLSSYVIAFAGFMEAFRLGRFRNNKIFFLTSLLMVWGFLPWIVILLVRFGKHAYTNMSTATISPFVGVAYAIAVLFNDRAFAFRILAVITPCALAVLTWLWAWQQHQAVLERIEK